ncbi:CSTF3-like protein [Mya arenaria]|uniref:CSTF3-like protein n=1 Tax=Mya arenaria TaxID=6604 RepID=A0ABY7EK95_MYAAR|nr:CSTF3-like protein [Mya arenaria]
MSKQDGFIADKIKKAEKRVEVSPHDTEAWSVLIRDAQLRTTEQARPVYERLVTQFSNSGRYWKIYIEHELKSKNYERVEKLFQRCLMKILNIDLWKLYLTYIKDTKSKLPSYREKMAQAYDFALDKMGMDIMSFSVWSDYINFLNDAVGSYAENQRITAVRKVFQRGVINPMINIEQLWKDYGHYENSINPLIAKKMIEDRSRDYMNARRVSKEYEVVTRGLNRNLPSVLPKNTPEEATQVDLWKKYINWEKENPLRTEDQALITKRVMFAYEQCLLCLGYHPDVWIEAANYLEHSSQILTEKGGYIQYMRFARRSEGIKSARTVFKLAREDTRSTYHVFMAAALMEYYCSKEKTIALKIFELGLKKFGDIPDYIRSYDNNTRVLFERVLSSGQIPHEKSIDIWSRFLSFESEVGDLASILKVEKRRSQAIEKFEEFEGKETALLIDRYKYKDLYPCTQSELKALGYHDLVRKQVVDMPTSRVAKIVLEAEEKRPEYPKPDLGQWLPFKPKILVPKDAHIVPGGVFPPPDGAASLMKMMPPPECFHGPFVIIDKFMEHFNQLEIPDGPTGENGYDGPIKYDAGTLLSLEYASGRKRRITEGEGSDDEESSSGPAPPINDIYRSRQQKRAK